MWFFNYLANWPKILIICDNNGRMAVSANCSSRVVTVAEISLFWESSSYRYTRSCAKVQQHKVSWWREIPPSMWCDACGVIALQLQNGLREKSPCRDYLQLMLKALLKGCFCTPLLASVDIAVLVTGPGLPCLCNQWMMQKNVFSISDGVITKTVGWIFFVLLMHICTKNVDM